MMKSDNGSRSHLPDSNAGQTSIDVAHSNSTATAVPTRSSDAEHLVVLDGLRGIAALVIGALHANQLLVSFDRYAHPYLAVDFFFCLSGFVIALAYERRLQTGMSFVEFTGRRLLRLFPMILLGSLLGGVVFFLGSLREGGSPIQTIVFTATSFALLPGGFLFGKEAYPVNNPIWSLFFEVMANLCYAALVPITTRALILYLAISGAVLIYLSYHFGSIAKLGFGSPMLFVGGFARVASPFIAGLIVYRFVGRIKFRFSPFIPIIGLLLLLAAPAPITWWFDVVAVIVIIPLILLTAIRSSASFMVTPLVILGYISYPFYLIHQPILRVMKHIGPFNRLVAHHPVIAVLLAIIAIATASYPVFLFYDQRLREMFGKIFFPKSVPIIP